MDSIVGLFCIVEVILRAGECTPRQQETGSQRTDRMLNVVCEIYALFYPVEELPNREVSGRNAAFWLRRKSLKQNAQACDRGLEWV